MNKIKSMEKALEYLAMNQSGKAIDLNKIDNDLILKIVEAGFLIKSNEEYKFNQKGVDFYIGEYGVNKKVNLFGI